MNEKNDRVLKSGEKAPRFCMPEGPGNRSTFRCLSEINSDFVVVYFYPEQSSPGCDVQAKEFAEKHIKFEREKAEVIAVSQDIPEKHIDLCSRNYMKLDISGSSGRGILRKYGVLSERKNGILAPVPKIKRATFLLDSRGKIIFIWKEVLPEGHAEEVLGKIKELKNKRAR